MASAFISFRGPGEEQEEVVISGLSAPLLLLPLQYWRVEGAVPRTYSSSV